ncbi:hypothetical protein KUTeg_014512 [Tegillarca granosa]|uniref:Cytochrome P450 n=1 Tax=Tegillarca granosa TaxID=220873 RepID=A0ABQ9EX34_TEGGR|nr:hypothetical protein KUTeg_014512 [Tegillarca granosa]
MNQSKSSGNLFIPFGAGSRVCIGQHLAWLELRLAIGILLNKFIFKEIKETPDLKIVCGNHAVVHPDKDIQNNLYLFAKLSFHNIGSLRYQGDGYKPNHVINLTRNC